MGSFKDLQLDLSYITKGDKSLVDFFLVPALSMTKHYKRSVGFFNSSALKAISRGLKDLVDQKGSIQLIASPKMSREDIETLKSAYDQRHNLIQERVTEQFKDALFDLNGDERKLLATLISTGIMDIKIVTLKTLGMYHDKLGVLIDHSDNRLVFIGSPNESETGFVHNYEKTRIFRSWGSDVENEYVVEEEREFDRLWNSENPHIETHDFSEALKRVIFEVVESDSPVKKPPYTLWDYQKEAVNAWVHNDYKGFFVMATGTGKTVTALFALKELLTKENILSIIAVPYKHLVTQWYEDVALLFPDCQIIQVAGEFQNWDKKLTEAIIDKKYSTDSKPIIVISTIASFSLQRFSKSVSAYSGNRVLIVDEAHRFYSKMSSNDYPEYPYRLGLSATPIFGKDLSKAHELLDFFGGPVFKLTIDDAIGKHLVNYTYTPLIVGISSDDEEKFVSLTRQMSYCFNQNSGKLIDAERLLKLHRARLRVLSMVDSKRERLMELLKEREMSDHFIVYCGDGKVYRNREEELRHLDDIKLLLNQYGYRPSQFTAKESMSDREILINLFTDGEISSLVAIRCLDEGINIPSIKTAIVLSSNDNYREFVQRRGRILRKHENKDQAEIIDFIVLPSPKAKDIATIELRRFKEYARLALNKNDLMVKLRKHLDSYELHESDIDYEDVFAQTEGEDIDD
jgi:superfamily II DNA or RNA helicase/HKD family nuclease